MYPTTPITAMDKARVVDFSTVPDLHISRLTMSAIGTDKPSEDTISSPTTDGEYNKYWVLSSVVIRT
jgi:hypothetical protein